MTEIFGDRWRKAWNPGPGLCIDETMLSWVGAISGKLQFIIRKPSPLGILLKTLADIAAGIMLHAEIVEGVPTDQLK